MISPLTFILWFLFLPGVIHLFNILKCYWQTLFSYSTSVFQQYKCTHFSHHLQTSILSKHHIFSHLTFSSKLHFYMHSIYYFRCYTTSIHVSIIQLNFKNLMSTNVTFLKVYCFVRLINTVEGFVIWDKADIRCFWEKQICLAELVAVCEITKHCSLTWNPGGQGWWEVKRIENISYLIWEFKSQGHQTAISIKWDKCKSHWINNKMRASAKLQM